MPLPLREHAERLARRAVEFEPYPQPPLVRTRYPVVLMHGFGALANVMQGGVLHAQAMHLRGHGVLAYAPHVNPYDTVAVRAAAWAERVDRVLDETGAGRVSLVAFSSGGLDARRLVSALGYADRVAAVVTLSTPHRGTPLAEFVLERPERLRAWLIGVMDFFGRAAYEAEEPRTEAALAELTPRFVCEEFNPAHPDAAGVHYASWAGRAGRGTDTPVSPPLLLGNRVLHGLAGVNDGIVPTASAEWAGFRGVLDADHARQIGLGAGGDFDSGAFFVDLVRDLAERGL